VIVPTKKKRLSGIEMITVCSVLLSIFTVFTQVRELGFGWVNDTQILRHQRVLAGEALNPWQYRVLPEYLLAGVIHVFETSGVAFPVAIAFISVRVIQNVVIFFCAALYYRKLGLNTTSTLLGLMLLAWGMSHALYGSDLSFDTYFDVLFYLLAGLAILNAKYAWIIPITLLAALNRETSGLIPFLLLAVNLQHWPEIRVDRRASIIAAIALCTYAAIFVGIRMVLGPRPLFIPYGNEPGLELFTYNVGRFVTWFEFIGTLGIIPFIALAYLRRWPRMLQLFLWIMVPVWLLIHLFASVMAETRLLLVPQAMVFIPGALWGISNVDNG